MKKILLVVFLYLLHVNCFAEITTKNSIKHFEWTTGDEKVYFKTTVKNKSDTSKMKNTPDYDNTYEGLYFTGVDRAKASVGKIVTVKSYNALKIYNDRKQARHYKILSELCVLLEGRKLCGYAQDDICLVPNGYLNRYINPELSLIIDKPGNYIITSRSIYIQNAESETKPDNDLLVSQSSNILEVS